MGFDEGALGEGLVEFVLALQALSGRDGETERAEGLEAIEAADVRAEAVHGAGFEGGGLGRDVLTRASAWALSYSARLL